MRVLFLTHRLPYAPNRGDRIRAYHIVRTLTGRVNLEIASLVHDGEEEKQADSLRNLGVTVHTLPVERLRNARRAVIGLATGMPMTHALLDAPNVGAVLERICRERKPDVVLAYCSGMSRFALESPLRDRPLVMDLVDVDSEKWAALARTATWSKRWVYRREARRLADFERLAAAHARATLVVNDQERSAFQAVAPGADVRVLPNGVDVASFRPRGPAQERPHVVFCGVMNYEPNAEGAIWFSQDVWPRVIARRPDARLSIVGSRPTAAVSSLARRDTTITVTGHVPDVRPYLWDAAVAVAPLLTARGVQNKVLEAIAAGLPTVVTPAVDRGLPWQVRPGCVVAGKAESFAKEILTLLERPAGERRTLAALAAIEDLTWEQQLHPLADILMQAAESAPALVFA